MKSRFDEAYEQVMKDRMDEGWKDIALAGLVLIGSQIPLAIHRYVDHVSKNSTSQMTDRKEDTDDDVDPDTDVTSKNNNVRTALQNMGIKVDEEQSAFEKWMLSLDQKLAQEILKDMSGLKPEQIKYLESFEVFTSRTKDADMKRAGAIGTEIVKAVMQMKAANIMLEHWDFDKTGTDPANIMKSTVIRMADGKVYIGWAGINREYDITPYLSKMDIGKYELIARNR